jgi:outer membrane lipoprotein carrier protein
MEACMRRVVLIRNVVSLGVAALACTGVGAVARAQPGAAQPSPSLPPVQTVVNQVQAFYNATSTFVSSFEQSFLVKAYAVTKTSRGVVTFAKPGLMDWTYTNPPGNRVVSNGSTLTVYDAANQQVVVRPVSGAQYPAALSFMTGQGQLSQTCNFQLAAGTTMSFPGGYVLIGTPIVPTPAYEKVLFYVDAQTFQVRRVLLLDAQGNRNRFDFLSPSVNGAVPASQFAFTPPAGTTIVP